MHDVREEIINDIKMRLGHGIVDLELDPEHFEYAIKAAIERYRQRSSNALEESFIFLQIQPDTATYQLPTEVQEIRAVYRRTIGGSAGGAAIDPFSLAFTNNIYMVQNPGGLGGGGAGTLATYDFAMQYQELVGRMFGRDVLFTWDKVSRKIMFQRRFHAEESICLHAYNARPDHVLLADVYARVWLRDWATAVCKQIMGEARSMFQSGLGGPQGGVTLNGDQLKQDAKEEMERLEEEIKNFVDAADTMPFTIG